LVGVPLVAKKEKRKKGEDKRSRFPDSSDPLRPGHSSTQKNFLRSMPL
jgi:hypothetical protein